MHTHVAVGDRILFIQLHILSVSPTCIVGTSVKGGACSCLTQCCSASSDIQVPTKPRVIHVNLTPGHSSAADETWYWKHLRRSTFLTQGDVFVDCSCRIS